LPIKIAVLLVNGNEHKRQQYEKVIKNVAFKDARLGWQRLSPTTHKQRNLTSRCNKVSNITVTINIGH